jgi:pimeloyl-ACP methyl ester carboxylesterase
MPTSPDRLPTACVFVPGLGLGAEAWQPTLNALGARGYAGSALEVVLLPGFGTEAGREADLRPTSLASLLVDGLRPSTAGVVLVGHSASCQIAARAAMLAPDIVRGLVLVGPTTDPRAASWPRLAARWLDTAVHEPPRQLPSVVRQYHRTGLATMRRAMDAARHDRIDVCLRDVSVPVRIVRGAHDRIAPRDWVDLLADCVPAEGSARSTVSLPEGGHMVPLTRGALVAGQVAAFVEHLDTDGG